MNKTMLLALLALSVLSFASCGSSSQVMKATAFSGGAISGFAGPDGTDEDSRQVARNVMDLRTFDFINDSFVVANGPVTSVGLGGGSYGTGQGTMILGVERAAVLQFIDSTNPAVTDVQLSGDFDHRLAQRSIDSPGVSFVGSWRLSFTMDGRERVLTFVQNLTGSQFTPLS